MDIMHGAVPNGPSGYKFKADCPFCGKEMHFYFNTKSKKAICFKCMDSSIVLRDEFFNDDGAYAPTVSFSSLKQAAQKLFVRTKEPVLEVDLDEISAPLNQEDYPQTYEYAIGRGFTDTDINKYHLRAGHSFMDEERGFRNKKWSGRLVFPVYENGIPIYAVGRSYIGAANKYVNITVPKEGIVYNIDNVDGRCIVCEGIISSIAAERTTEITSTCLLGKTITDLQAYKIGQRAKKVWLSLDGGVPKRITKSVIRTLLRNGLDVWLVSLPDPDDPDMPEYKDKGDPDELGVEYLDFFRKAIRVSYL